MSDMWNISDIAVRVLFPRNHDVLRFREIVRKYQSLSLVLTALRARETLGPLQYISLFNVQMGSQNHTQSNVPSK